MKINLKDNRIFFRVIRVVTVGILCLSSVGTLVYAWMFSDKRLSAYAPVSSPELLNIGAGHRDAENGTFEDIRYMYFDGLDAKDEEYFDKVFCVYGKGVEKYKIQLAYTTNNPFTYEIYPASESEVYSATAVAYSTHQTPSVTYYYSINGEVISGNYLNKTVENGKTVANDEYHSLTYDYNESSYDNVNEFAEPIYWQTSSAETGSEDADFVNYYILRVHKNGKENNDRETDVLCIAAKAVMD